jgi:hypothetical protein
MRSADGWGWDNLVVDRIDETVEENDGVRTEHGEYYFTTQQATAAGAAPSGMSSAGQGGQASGGYPSPQPSLQPSGGYPSQYPSPQPSGYPSSQPSGYPSQ